MTPTTSANTMFGRARAVYLRELKNARTPLIIFSVISGFALINLFWLIVISFSTADKENYMDDRMMIFHIVASYVIFAVSCVFMIIHCMRVFSYLHNKRKADMIAPLPIKAAVLYYSKAAAAYTLSVVPPILIIGLVALITLLLGFPVNPWALRLFWMIPLGGLACISFFGLLAVCCGRGINALMIFAVVCGGYPLAMSYVRGMISSFFLGTPTYLQSDNLLFTALCPINAYIGHHYIYWLLFSAGCLALCFLLLPRRKNELVQNAFVFALPCYAAEMLATLISGFSMGLMFGSTRGFGSAYGAFVIGFLTAGATGFLISHVILFHGFRGILKSFIGFDVVTVAALIFTAVCCFGSQDYVSYVPKAEDVKSAGYIQFDSGYNERLKSTPSVIKSSAGDFTDAEDIEAILASHRVLAEEATNLSAASKFSKIMSGSLYSRLFGYEQSHSFAYRLQNGKTVVRVYKLEYFSYSVSDYINSSLSHSYPYNRVLKAVPPENITNRAVYISKYSPLSTIRVEEIKSIYVDVKEIGRERFYENENVNMQDLINALSQDITNSTDAEIDSEHYCCTLMIYVNDSKKLFKRNYQYSFEVYDCYENTLRLLEQSDITVPREGKITDNSNQHTL